MASQDVAALLLMYEAKIALEILLNARIYMQETAWSSLCQLQ